MGINNHTHTYVTKRKALYTVVSQRENEARAAALFWRFLRMARVTVIAQLFKNPFLPLGSAQPVVFLINLRQGYVHVSVCKCVSVCVCV